MKTTIFLTLFVSYILCANAQAPMLFDPEIKNNTKPESLESFKVFTNPSNGETLIELNLLKNEKVDLYLYDANGLCVQKIVLATYFHSGNYLFTLEKESLPAGVYYCQLKIGAWTQTEQLVIAGI